MRLISGASIAVLLWAMPKYVRPEATPLIKAVVRSGVPSASFKRHMLSEDDIVYLQEHGMPNNIPWRIVDVEPTEGFTEVVPDDVG